MRQNAYIAVVFFCSTYPTMIKRMLWLIAALQTSTLGFAQGQDIEFTEFDLDNGLHVILHEDHSVPIVAVTVLYHVGSKDEDSTRTGFAHFFEHLLFEGSENVARGEFDQYLEEAGATNNANTSSDRTFYYEILPSNQLGLGLWLESERMLHARVDSIGVETQRQVVKEERRQRVDNQPYGSIFEEILKRAYQQHPYRWPTIGSMEHLEAATDEDYVNFYKKFYVPNNATLSIAGDLNTEETIALVKKYFGDIPRGQEVTHPQIQEPEQTAEIRDVVEDNIQLPAVVHAYKTPGIGSEDFYAVEMLTTLLSAGESSWLNQEVKNNEQKALAVGAFPLSLEDDPSLSIAYAIANAKVPPEELETSMNRQYQRAREELISEREFQKLRNQIESQFYQQNAEVAGVAENLADYHVYYGNTNLINQEIDRYMAVTREDIQRVAKKYLVDRNRVTLYYVPKSS